MVRPSMARVFTWPDTCQDTQKRRFYFDCIVRLGSNAITETSVGACSEEASWMTGQTIALNGGACTA